MRNPDVRFTIRRIMAVIAIAVMAIAVIALGTRALVVAVRSYRQRAEGRGRRGDRAVRDRAVAIAARKYEEIHGEPPPSATTVAPGRIAHVIARREADRRRLLVSFGYQYVVNKQRDSSGRPIPFRSGLTVLESFRVKDDGTCEYVGLTEAGEF